MIIVPQLIQSTSALIKEIPTYISNFSTWIESSPLTAKNAHVIKSMISQIQEFFTQFIDTNVESIATSLASTVKSIAMVILNLLIGIIISVYTLANRKKFLHQAKKIIYAIFSERQCKFIIEELHVADCMFVGFINGKVLDSAIIGAISYIVLNFILHMPYALFISVIIGVTNVIPVFGPFIGAIPSCLVVLAINPLKAIQFLIFIVILQQIDGHIIGPKLIGNATGLNTFWVLFGIILFGGLFGIIGMLIGVPITAVLYDVVKKFLNYKLNLKGIDENYI